MTQVQKMPDLVREDVREGVVGFWVGRKFFELTAPKELRGDFSMDVIRDIVKESARLGWNLHARHVKECLSSAEREIDT